MAEFDWGLVKEAVQFCRSHHGGKLPEDMTLCLPRGTHDAIVELAEDLFPNNYVVTADVEVPVFLAKVPLPKVPTMEDHFNEILGHPPTAEQKAKLQEIIGREIQKFTQPNHTHQMPAAFDIRAPDPRRRFVLAGNHAEAMDYVTNRGSFDAVRHIPLSGGTKLTGMRWDDRHDELIVWGTWYERSDIREVIETLAIVGLPPSVVRDLKAEAGQWRRSWMRKNPLIRGDTPHIVVQDELSEVNIEQIKKMYHKNKIVRNPFPNSY